MIWNKVMNQVDQAIRKVRMCIVTEVQYSVSMQLLVPRMDSQELLDEMRDQLLEDLKA